MKISQKLTFGFVCIASLAAVSGYISVGASKKALQKSIGQQYAMLADELLGDIDRTIYGRIEQLQIYAEDLAKEPLLVRSNQEFEKVDDVQKYIDEKDRQWQAAGEEIIPFMRELINNELSEEIREEIESKEFYKEKYGYPVFGEVFVTNKYGVNAAQSQKTTDYYQADESWWQKAKEDGLYVADVEYDRSADVYSADICVRINDKEGNFLGVLKAVSNIKEVISLIIKAENDKRHNTTKFKLLTKDTKVIYATEELEFLEPLPTKLAELLQDKDGHGLHYFVSVSDRPSEGKQLCSHAHSRGYKDFKGFGWILMIEHETEEIFAPVAELKDNILIISLTITILSILLGFLISISLSSPIRKLRDITADIGKGNLDVQIGTKSNDEIGELAVSFDDMRSKLRESYLNLEEKVRERTSELSTINMTLENEVAGHLRTQRILKERIKELNCFYKLSKLIEQPEISLGEIFWDTAELIRNAYQYPDTICVRIIFGGVHYKTANFEKSELSQYAEIKVHGEKTGVIEVYYLGDKNTNKESLFLKEERDLLDAVAEHLGSIAGRKQTANKLTLFRNLTDQSNDCIFVIEPKWGRFLDVNGRACESLGYTREELFGMSFKDIEESTPDDSLWQEHIKGLKHKGDITVEGLHRRKDGATFFAETSLKLVTCEREDCIIAVARDVTERKRVENALRESEERFKSISESAKDAIIMMGPQGEISFWNTAAENTFGYSRDEVIGKNLHALLAPERYQPAHRNAFSHFQLTGEGAAMGKTLELAALRKDGSEFSIELSVSPLRLDGQWHAVGIMRDVTERKRAEQIQAQLLKEVESINQELRDFAYVVSHDLKAPLRGIKTLAGWISSDYSDKLDENGKEQMELLMQRVDRMHNLIDGVLQYSRVGRVREELVQINLNELIPEIIDMVSPPENISISIKNELPVIECEETRIRQLFQNLLSNSIKYMDKPEGKIDIGCIQECDFWKFSIADNGCGIEEKNFEKIFKIFQTLSPRDEFESTGVGLSVVKKIVELYDGKIWVQSEPGKGSTFYFTLPKGILEVKDDAQLEKVHITC